MMRNNGEGQPLTVVKQKSTYTVQEIAEILGISLRSAYNLCNDPMNFKVLHIGRSIRIHKESFDQWFHACTERHLR